MVFGSIFVLAGAHKLSFYKHCGVEKYPPYYLRSSHYIKILYRQIGGCRMYLLKKLRKFAQLWFKITNLLVKKSC